jgi:hypothetical protein
MRGQTRDVTPAQYKPGSIKQQPPSWHGIVDHAHSHIAVRTSLPDVGTTEQDWFCMCAYTGGHLTGYDEVRAWPDIYVAP